MNIDYWINVRVEKTEFDFCIGEEFVSIKLELLCITNLFASIKNVSPEEDSNQQFYLLGRKHIRSQRRMVSSLSLFVPAAKRRVPASTDYNIRTYFVRCKPETIRFRIPMSFLESANFLKILKKKQLEIKDWTAT